MDKEKNGWCITRDIAGSSIAFKEKKWFLLLLV